MSNLDAGQNIGRRLSERRRSFFLWPLEELYMAWPCKPMQLEEFRDVAFEATHFYRCGREKQGRVWSFRFGDWGSRFGVRGLAFGVRGSPFRNLELLTPNSELRTPVPELRTPNLGPFLFLLHHR